MPHSLEERPSRRTSSEPPGSSTVDHRNRTRCPPAPHVASSGVRSQHCERIQGIHLLRLQCLLFVPIVLFRGVTQHHVEIEIWELRFNLAEIIQIEELSP